MQRLQQQSRRHASSSPHARPRAVALDAPSRPRPPRHVGRPTVLRGQQSAAADTSSQRHPPCCVIGTAQTGKQAGGQGGSQPVCACLGQTQLGCAALSPLPGSRDPQASPCTTPPRLAAFPPPSAERLDGSRHRPAQPPPSRHGPLTHCTCRTLPGDAPRLIASVPVPPPASLQPPRSHLLEGTQTRRRRRRRRRPTPLARPARARPERQVARQCPPAAPVAQGKGTRTIFSGPFGGSCQDLPRDRPRRPPPLRTDDVALHRRQARKGRRQEKERSDRADGGGGGGGVKRRRKSLLPARRSQRQALAATRPNAVDKPHQWRHWLALGV